MTKTSPRRGASPRPWRRAAPRARWSRPSRCRPGCPDRHATRPSARRRCGPRGQGAGRGRGGAGSSARRARLPTADGSASPRPRGLAGALALATSSPSTAMTAIGVLTFTPSVPAATRILPSGALVDRLDLHGRLVGLDLGDHVAGLDGVALLLQPLGEVALLHGRRERGHQDFDRHVLRRGAPHVTDQMSVQSSDTSGSGIGLREIGGVGDDVAHLLVDCLEFVLAEAHFFSSQPQFSPARSGRARTASSAPPPSTGTWPGRTWSGRDSGRSASRG